MRIDSHVHLVDRGWVHDDFMTGIARITSAAVGKETAILPDPGQLADLLWQVFADSTGEKLVKTLDTAGLDMACVFTVDYGLATGEQGVTIEEQNRMVAEAAANYPHRLIPFFAIDPRRPEADTLFQQAIEQWGVKGLKLHPCAGFYPSDAVCYPLYRRCARRGLPVIVHAGSQPPPFKSRYARPAYLDDVAADFPDLKIVMAHVGHNWWEEALLVGSVKPNVHFDFSGWQRTYKLQPAIFYTMLRRLLDEVGPWRVFFGTDGPYLNAICPLDEWVAAVEKPDLSDCPGMSLGDDEKKIIMGESFAKLVGLAE